MRNQSEIRLKNRKSGTKVKKGLKYQFGIVITDKDIFALIDKKQEANIFTSIK